MNAKAKRKEPDAPTLEEPDSRELIPKLEIITTVDSERNLAVSASPLDLPTEIFAAALERRRQNRAVVMNWIRSSLVESVDYGRIHIMGKDKCQHARSGFAMLCDIPAHWSKPVLFKSGAEKICGMLGVTVQFPTLKDYEQAALNGNSLRVVILRCELRDSQGRAVAEGIGARNLQQDYGDLNKSLKMASKSAIIDATLRLAGLSEVFSQDTEDVGTETCVSPPETSSTPKVDDAAPAPTKEQLVHLEQRIKTLKLDRNRVLAWLQKATKGQVKSFEQLTDSLYEHLVAKLEKFAEHAMAPTEQKSEKVGAFR